MIKFIDEEKGYRFISSLTGKEYAILDLVNLGGTGSSGLIAIADPKNEKRDGGPEILGYLTSNYTSKDDDSFLDDLDHFFSSYIESIEKEQSSSENVGPADNIVDISVLKRRYKPSEIRSILAPGDICKHAGKNNKTNSTEYCTEVALLTEYSEKLPAFSSRSESRSHYHADI